MVEHLMPKTFEEALEALTKQDYIKIAGGTDLMVQNRSSAGLAPEFDRPLLFLYQLKELNYVKLEYNTLRIGSMTPMETLLQHPLVPKTFKEVLQDIASPGIRMLATLAGNIGNASPAADTLVYLYALKARIILEKVDHCRMLPIDIVITGPRQTIIEPAEIIKEIQIPIRSWTHTSWIKVGGRKSDAISKASFIGLACIESGILKDMRLALGAVYPTVLVDHTIEEAYTGLPVADLIAQKDAIKAHFEAIIRPIDDQRSNKNYRKQVVRNMIDQFIEKLKTGVGS